jgi:hypothetical protein
MALERPFSQNMSVPELIVNGLRYQPKAIHKEKSTSCFASS